MSKLVITVEDIPESERQGEKVYAISLVWDEETRLGAEAADQECRDHDHPQDECPKDAFWQSSPARMAGVGIESAVRQVALLYLHAAGCGPVELSTETERLDRKGLINIAVASVKKLRLQKAAPSN